jgi:archaellum biogenesis ATPase FlaH
MDVWRWYDQYIVPNAAYNRRGSRFKCLEGTREEIISKIVLWASDDGSKSILWLSGAAGLGKSAISQTIAEQFAAEGTLAASFFFLRGGGHRSKFSRLLTSLAYQLTLSMPVTKPALERALEGNRSIPYQSIDDQLRKLIIAPVLAADKPSRPMVIIIDALDECDDFESITEFIIILAAICSSCRHILRFLLTSRAEDYIHQKFHIDTVRSSTHLMALEDFDAHADILTFLKSRFADIYRDNPRLFQGIPQPWPSVADLNSLSQQSSGLFVFASTVVDYVTDSQGAPQQKLKDVLRSHTGLDPLYIQVLSAASQFGCFGRVLAAIALLFEQLSISDLAHLLRLEAVDIVHALMQIQSILQIPKNNDQPVLLNHMSLRDFLTDQRRSQNHYLEPFISHTSILTDCLLTMTTNLQQDVFPNDKAQK